VPGVPGALALRGAEQDAGDGPREERAPRVQVPEILGGGRRRPLLRQTVLRVPPRRHRPHDGVTKILARLLRGFVCRSPSRAACARGQRSTFVVLSSSNLVRGYLSAPRREVRGALG